tara:strand:- start:4072 stop:4950 length:879 start_codon:yes stop_codon:yes gene_type:complete
MKKKIPGYIQTIILIFGSITGTTLFQLGAASSDIVTLGGVSQPRVEVDLNILEGLPNLNTSPNFLIGNMRLNPDEASENHNQPVKKLQELQSNEVTKVNMAPLNEKKSTLGKVILPQKPAFTIPATPGFEKLKKISSFQPPPKPNLDAIGKNTKRTVKEKPKPSIDSKQASTQSRNKIRSVPKLKSQSKKVTARLLFEPDKKRLAAGEKLKLTKIYNLIGRDKSKRIQLIAYASASAGNPTKARRLSLTRALEVRRILIEKGISSRQMDVRALGNRNGTGEPNRVDVMITEE